jgi:predicted dehydrogenase
MGTTHAAAWAAEGVPVMAFAPEPEAAAALPAVPLAGSLAELIDAVDIVDVCTPTDTHVEVCLAAAAAGRHVICEKPLALSVADAERIVDACDAAGVRLFVAHVLRYMAEYVEAQRVVASGAIGEPAVLRLKRAAFRPRKPAGHWLFDERRSGGMILDLLIHDIDFARWLAGDVVSIHARSAAIARPDLGVEHAFVILSHASGAISHLTGSWAYSMPTFRTSLEIAGSHGLIEYDSARAHPIVPYLHVEPDSGQGAVGIARALSREDPFRDELRDFLRAIRDGGEPRVTAHDGLEAVRIGVAAVTSARTGQPVRVAEAAP